MSDKCYMNIIYMTCVYEQNFINLAHMHDCEHNFSLK